MEPNRNHLAMLTGKRRTRDQGSILISLQRLEVYGSRMLNR